MSLADLLYRVLSWAGYRPRRWSGARPDIPTWSQPASWGETYVRPDFHISEDAT